MKTNQRDQVPVNRPYQFPAGVTAPPAGASTTSLSENAFYLIAIAVLLRQSAGAQDLRQVLVPGKFVSYGS
jgi:hypothetical protein